MRTIVIFGASGDLAKRMLMPSLSKIHSDDLRIIAYARSPLQETYSRELRKFYNYGNNFPEKVTYIQGVYHDISNLRNLLDENTYYYFSVPPEIYLDLLNQISKFNFKGIGIEKPFGTDHESFMKLSCFKKKGIFFIDHYLVKPLLIAVPTILNNNTKMKNLFQEKHISLIEACFNESILANGRMYFEKTGIIKDVMQNHLMVILGSILSSITKNEDQDQLSVRADVFERMSIDLDQCVFGQYTGYNEELGSVSTTETFSSFLINFNHNKWNGVPILMTAGKGLQSKNTEVSFFIKKESFELFISLLDPKIAEEVYRQQIKELKICFNFSPMSEIYLNVSTCDAEEKYILYDKKIVDNLMNSEYGNLRGHEVVFERLINEKPFNHACFREISALWKLFDPIIHLDKSLFYYNTGVYVPKEALELRNNILYNIK